MAISLCEGLIMTLEEFKSIFEAHGLEINTFLSLDKNINANVYIQNVYGRVKFADYTSDIPIYERDPKTLINHIASHVLGQVTIYPLKRINTVDGELCEWDTYTDLSKQNHQFKTTKYAKAKNFVDEQMEILKKLRREYKRNQIKWIGEDKNSLFEVFL